MSREETPVLVVGAGPAGAAAALALARHGVRCLLVERRRERSPMPRATGLSLRSMELLRAWGLEDDVLDAAPEIDWIMWVSRTLAEVADGAGSTTGQPTRVQSALVSPTAPACVAQADVERALLDRIGAYDEVTVERGTEVVAVHVAADGVRAELREPASGRARTVSARHLVAADGARGSLRRSLRIPVKGSERVAERVGAQFRAPLWALLGEHRYVVYSATHPAGHGSFVPAGRGDRWVYAREWDPTRERQADYDVARMTELIRLGAGAPDLPVEIDRVRTLSYGIHIAERFREGPAFLVGDAAHRMTPRGGMGLNTAIQDGHDLGWKLAWVHRGWAGDELLDTYETERRPVAEHQVARSVDPVLERDPAEELQIELAGRIAHTWIHVDGARRSTLDLLGDGLTLFTGPDDGRWRSAAESAARGPSIVVRSLPRLAARALGIRAGGAVLARPDGLPVARWADAEDAAELRTTRAAA